MRQLLSRQSLTIPVERRWATGPPAAGGVIGERWALTGTTGINAAGLSAVRFTKPPAND
jgi:hypothetical protein